MNYRDLIKSAGEFNPNRIKFPVTQGVSLHTHEDMGTKYYYEAKVKSESSSKAYDCVIVLEKATKGIHVRCNCEDFLFTFAYANHEKDCLYGDVPVYQKKTDRAPKNPDNIPGACKHLLSAFAYMEKKKLIK
jgi:hypothetical protein